jgi:GWxTD domain-containing protein
MLIFTRHHFGVLILGSVFIGACSSSGTRVNPEPDPRLLPAAGAPAPDVSELYRQIGLLAAPGAVSFVGRISTFATASPDTTLVLVSISLPNRSLTFAREGERYRAPYEVKISLDRGDTAAANVDVMEIVRVGSFREINRADESIIFQHFFHVKPGTYTVSAMVRDVGGSRSATQEAPLNVPVLTSGKLSTPLLVYEAKGRTVLDSAPSVLASPRSSAVFGRDSTVAIYVEGYGQGSRLPVDFIIRNDKAAQVWRDSAVLARHGAVFSGIVNVPISTVGVGVGQISFTRRDAADTVKAPLFVSFGEDIPLMSFEDMLGFLRFFSTQSKLNALRSAPLESRATVWANFLRSTDPVPETAINEEMQAYFSRIQVANIQFRMDRNPGWLSDRGMVFVGLGEPDQILERNVNQALTATQMSGSTRVQIWQYRNLSAQLVFYEETGRWRLYRTSETEFLSLLSRRQR